MPRKKKPAREFVVVCWRDAAGSDDADVQPEVALTYGEIVRMSETEVVVSGEVFADGDRRQNTAIPAGMVVSIGRGKFPEPPIFTKRREEAAH